MWVRWCDAEKIFYVLFFSWWFSISFWNKEEELKAHRRRSACKKLEKISVSDDDTMGEWVERHNTRVRFAIYDRSSAVERKLMRTWMKSRKSFLAVEDEGAENNLIWDLSSLFFQFSLIPHQQIFHAHHRRQPQPRWIKDYRWKSERTIELSSSKFSLYWLRICDEWLLQRRVKNEKRS